MQVINDFINSQLHVHVTTDASDFQLSLGFKEKKKNIVSNILVWKIPHIFSIHELNKMKKKEGRKKETKAEGRAL